MRRLLIPALLVLAAAAASAQEYGRSSSGELQMFAKRPTKLSASLGFRLGAGKGAEATLGGTLLEDRMWFFVSGLRNDERFVAPVERAVPAATAAKSESIDAKLITQLGASRALAASYVESTPLLSVPQSFLSLRYTGVISPSSFFTASVSTSR